MPFDSRTPSTPRRAALATLLGALLLAAAPAFAGGVEASDAWIRWLPAGLPAGGYLHLRNTGDHAVALVGASSPDYAQAMLHNSVKHGDTMEMTAVDKVEIPAHGSVDFKPGAHHIMLMQPRHDIHPGDHVPVTLEFADGARLKVDFEVRKSDAPAGAPGSDTMKGMDSMQGMGDMPGMDMHGAHQP